MRVGLVCAHAGPSVDGPTVGTHQHIARVAAELAARGHDVRVYERRDARGQESVDLDGYHLERV
ncbi:glycosyltransferase family 1 protein, partial [Micromonospora sp. AMSO31t]